MMVDFRSIFDNISIVSAYIKQLEKENTILRQENEFIMKYACRFAKENGELFERNYKLEQQAKKER